MSAEDWMWVATRGAWLRGDGLELVALDEWHVSYVVHNDATEYVPLCGRGISSVEAQAVADQVYPSGLRPPIPYVPGDRANLEALIASVVGQVAEAEHRAEYQRRRLWLLRADLAALGEGT